VARELDFGLRMSDRPSRSASAHTLLTSMPDVPSKTWSTIRICSREMRLHGVPGRRRGFLFTISIILYTSSRLLPRASRTWPERSVPSGSVRDTISLNCGNLTCPARELLSQPPSSSTATHVVENDQGSVDTADGVVANPRRNAHHAGVNYVRHGGGVGLSVWEKVSLEVVRGPR
jgi:hypothetical protein